MFYLSKMLEFETKSWILKQNKEHLGFQLMIENFRGISIENAKKFSELPEILKN